MHTLVYIGIGIIVALGLLFFVSPSARSFAYTLWLIARIEPYAQVCTAGELLIVGYSTAYGTGAVTSNLTVGGRIGADFPELTISTNAVNGRVIAEATKALKTYEVSRDTILLLQIGGNDILGRATDEEIMQSITALLAEASRRFDAVLFMSTGNVGAAPRFVTDGQPDAAMEARSRRARQIFIDVSAQYGVHYIDLFTEPADDVFLHESERYIAADGLHPSGEGYGVWYEALQPVLTTVLQLRLNPP